MAQYVIISTFPVSSYSPSSEIDPETAKTPFFASENMGKWAVPEQWHAYLMEKRQALSRSGASANGSHAPKM
jgi:hypothetical protein